MKKALWASAAVAALSLGGVAAVRSQPTAAPGMATAERSCEALAALAFPDAKITLAKELAAGSFELPVSAETRGPRALKVPAFCRVAMTLTPSADSDIKVEVWLPKAWNGKFQAVGNGGWSGAVQYGGLARALAAGYAAASTDTGHEGDAGNGAFALGHPEKLIDFGWRAVHEMAVKGKAVVAAYYGKAPRYSYFNGCSSGGKQALKEAQKFPADFDGIIAGAPASHWVRLNVSSLWPAHMNLRADGSPILTPVQFSLLQKASLARCDAADGLADGEIADPRACKFKASDLLCKGGPAAECLTADQVKAAEGIYDGTRKPNGTMLFPGAQPGSEGGWAISASRPMTPGQSYFRYVVFNDAKWDWRTLDFDKDVDKGDRADAGLASSVDPDLAAFRKRGGKLITYHGWSDAVIAPENSVNYYESVRAKVPGAEGFYRLFMVPNMGHCGGGYQADWMKPLERWVEQGEAPDQVVADRIADAAPTAAMFEGSSKTKGQRPICAYPTVATYKGSGNADEAASWSCKASARGARPGRVMVLQNPRA